MRTGYPFSPVAPTTWVGCAVWHECKPEARSVRLWPWVGSSAPSRAPVTGLRRDWGKSSNHDRDVLTTKPPSRDDRGLV